MNLEDVSFKPIKTTKMISDGVEVDIPRVWVYDTWEDLKWGRDKELAQTDWWVMPDRTTTDAQRAYRQFLRDLPQNYLEAGVQAAEDAWSQYDISGL